MAAAVFSVPLSPAISCSQAPFPMKTTILRFSLVIATAFFAGSVASSSAATYREPFRPQFHFTPEKNWMNDPNGMVYYDGEYHLFYQYNPFGYRWGHMSWGHAVSPDLVRWEHLPVALLEENGVMIFSGSAVVDWKNTSGFGRDGKPPLVAIYTGHYTEKPLQNQHLAYSNDRGRTWTKYAGNPVLDIGVQDFRDPKVMWHEPTGKWIMAVSLPADRKVRFYGSPNLKDWTLLSEFGPSGAVKGIWECPDLFPLRIEGTSKSKWVLIVNIGAYSVAGGSGCQYFVGDFDGSTFTAEIPRPVEQPKDTLAPTGRVLADFEGESYGDWKAGGTAFGSGPVKSHDRFAGNLGAGLVSSVGAGASAQGTLTSPDFTIDAKRLNFLIGGGNLPGETCVNLVVEGAVVHSATGRNNRTLDWQSWDVREFKGKEAQLQIVDRNSGEWGTVLVDHIVLGDEAFTPPVEPALWVDYGPDFYASVSWSDVPPSDGRRLWLGWMSNWNYANEVPTLPWRSAMSIPRELTLRQVDGEWLLVQTPVRELRTLRKDRERIQLRQVTGAADLEKAAKIAAGLFELDADLQPTEDAVFSFKIRKSDSEETVVRIDVPNRQLILDRTRSSSVDFHPQFPGAFPAPIRLINGRLKLRLFVDTSSVELLINDGEVAQTSLILPSADARGLDLEVARGALKEANLEVWRLDRITPIPGN